MPNESRFNSEREWSDSVEIEILEFFGKTESSTCWPFPGMVVTEEKNWDRAHEIQNQS
jgi:hypothetical protein